MLCGWMKKQLDYEIERKSREIAKAVTQHERPDKIYLMRREMARLEAIRAKGEPAQSSVETKDGGIAND